METNFISLFRYFKELVYIPLYNALEVEKPFNELYIFLDNLINGVFNMFGDNTNTITINFTNELVASLLSNFLMIYLTYLVIKVFLSVAKALYKSFKEMFINDKKNNKEWRQQWKRKKS